MKVLCWESKMEKFISEVCASVFYGKLKIEILYATIHSCGAKWIISIIILTCCLINSCLGYKEVYVCFKHV